MAVPVTDAAVGTAASMADAQTTTHVQTADASTSHNLVLGVGLTAAATQTTLDGTALEDTVESTLCAFDGSQAAQLALEQRVAELEGQLANLAQNADASTQTELDIEGLDVRRACCKQHLARGRQHRVAKRGSESLTAQIVIETQICLISP